MCIMSVCVMTRDFTVGRWYIYVCVCIYIYIYICIYICIYVSIYTYIHTNIYDSGLYCRAVLCFTTSSGVIHVWHECVWKWRDFTVGRWYICVCVWMNIHIYTYIYIYIYTYVTIYTYKSIWLGTLLQGSAVFHNLIGCDLCVTWVCVT